MGIVASPLPPHAEAGGGDELLPLTLELIFLLFGSLFCFQGWNLTSFSVVVVGPSLF
jgi:hypothetical protein